MMRRSLLAALTGALLCPLPGQAQLKASELARTEQTIAGTHLSMEFSRPSARGRDPLFGGVVPWSKRWTPGANMATTLEVDRDVTLGGVEVPAGHYSLWFDLSEDGAWTLLLDEKVERYHVQPPADDEVALRIPAEPVFDAPHRETLLWYVDEIRGTTGELRMHWGPVLVPFTLEVPLDLALEVPAEEAQVVAGTWTGHWLDGEGEETAPVRFTFHPAAEDRVAGTMATRPDDPQDVDLEFLLSPLAELIYGIVRTMDGAPVELTEGLSLEFSRGPDGGVDELLGRTDDDRVMLRATPTGAGTH